jgi:hypothetical protein
MLYHVYQYENLEILSLFSILLYVLTVYVNSVHTKTTKLLMVS